MVDRNYYLFRSCPNIPLKDDVVGMGWDDLNFCEFDNADEIIRDIVQVRKWNIGRKATHSVTSNQKLGNRGAGLQKEQILDQLVTHSLGQRMVFDFQYSLSMKGLQNSLTHFCLFYDTKSCCFTDNSFGLSHLHSKKLRV